MFSGTAASWFETHRFAMLLTMRNSYQTLMVRRRALRGVSKDVAGSIALEIHIQAVIELIIRQLRGRARHRIRATDHGNRGLIVQRIAG